MKLLLMFDGQVGNAIAGWLLETYPNDLSAMVTVKENDVCLAARKKKIPLFMFESEVRLQEELSDIAPFDLGILAWWPKLISREIMKLSVGGFINTHPSLLPYNRGKHPNFWAIVEEAPYGVSLHYVDEGIDSGDIVAQLAIPYGWEDTGETLYHKATQKMFELFKSVYPKIRSNCINRIPQDLSKGSLHYASEIDKASKIYLDKYYTARQLINLLRARTFSGYPSCYFEDNGITYEITVNIKKRSV